MGVDQGSGVWVLEDPLTNKGTAFSEEPEQGCVACFLGVVETLEQRVRRRSGLPGQPTDVARHINLRALQDTNETLFYRLVPTIGDLPVLTPPRSEWPAGASARSTAVRAVFSSPYPDRDRIGEIP
jgi:malate dehydrogenase (oxaloacetate-decarboxylating)